MKATLGERMRPLLRTISQSVRKYLITGVLVSLPLIVTVYVLWFVFSFLEGAFGDLVRFVFGRRIPGASIVLTVGLLLFIGMFAANVLGRRLIAFGERILMAIPIVRPIYNSVKQVIDAFSAQGSGNSFKQAVLIEYPRRGIYALAFVTNETVGPLLEAENGTLVAVFVPTTPNPTSGFILFLPQEDIMPTKLTVEQAFKLIISGGIILPLGPEALAEGNNRLLGPEAIPVGGDGKEGPRPH